MSFDALLRTGVQLANTLTDSLQVSVSVKRWASQTIRGAASYEDPITVSGIYGEKAEIIERQGNFIQVVGSLTVMDQIAGLGTPGRQDPFDAKDVFYLPGGQTGYPVLVEGPGDPAGGKFITKIWFGQKTS